MNGNANNAQLNTGNGALFCRRQVPPMHKAEGTTRRSEWHRDLYDRNGK